MCRDTIRDNTPQREQPINDDCVVKLGIFCRKELNKVQKNDAYSWYHVKLQTVLFKKEN